MSTPLATSVAGHPPDADRSPISVGGTTTTRSRTDAEAPAATATRRPADPTNRHTRQTYRHTRQTERPAEPSDRRIEPSTSSRRSGGEPQRVGRLRRTVVVAAAAALVVVLLLVGVPGRGGLGDGVPLVGPSPAGAAVPGLPFTETGCQGDSDSVARLYTAAFGRAPEAGGFDFWMDNYTGGSWGLPRMATFFAGSPEFVSTYGDLDELGFVRQLYRNVLGREGEAGGVAFWHGELQRGMTRGTLLLRFSESPENIRRSGTTEPTLGHFNTGRTGPWVCPPASPPADPPASPPVEPPLGPTAPTASLATVTSITDGDTLRVSPGGPVRIIGIDAPESGSCIAALATARLGELAPVGRTVTLLDDPARTDDRDRFDRLLRFVEVDGVDVGRQLILEGLATAFAFDGGSSRADDYAAAEATARNRGVGIWDATACTAPPAPQPVVPPTPTPEPDPTPPAADCHPAYSSPCLPIVDDLNCGDIRQVVILVDPRIDPYQLDGRGGTVDDGIGCESYG